MAKVIYKSIPTFVILLVLGCALTFFSVIFKKRKKEALYLFVALALGPGLLVNAVLKEHWGRARPSQILEFGGQKEFTRAFVIADQCEKNCSFVSGHAGTGFFVMAFYFITRRKKWIYIGMGYGALVGLGRIVQGGHFLSDVVLSGYFVYFTAWAIHRRMFGRDSQASP